MFNYHWNLEDDLTMRSEGYYYSFLTVEFNDDLQKWIGIVWGEIGGYSYYEQPSSVEVDSCCYDTAAAASTWCEAMDIIGYGQSLMWEIPIVEMEGRMEDGHYV